jgi:hypothetical protein
LYHLDVTILKLIKLSLSEKKSNNATTRAGKENTMHIYISLLHTISFFVRFGKQCKIEQAKVFLPQLQVRACKWGGKLADSYVAAGGPHVHRR